MEQSITFPFPKIMLPAKRFGLHTFKWMYAFFATDRSPDNRPVIDIQRRACWVGVALILQALNEIYRPWYMPFVPFLQPIESLIPFFFILGSFYAMWRVFRPATLKEQTQHLHTHPQRWQRIVLICTLITCIAGTVELGRSIYMGFFIPPLYTNDGTSLDTNAAILLLHGRNPYTDSNVTDLVRRFHIMPNWTTPLRAGQFSDRFSYPTNLDMRTVLDTDLKAGQAPEFESRVSYPALSFLTLVPLVALNISNVLPFYLLIYALIVFLGWRAARPELRPWVLALAFANVSMWTSVVGGNLDILYSLFILLAWLLRSRGWWSALLLGLAVATKQQAWFFVPFYTIMVWRQYNFTEVFRRLSLAGAIALAINLPFILWNPHAWLTGVLAPLEDPMFPMGVGIISFSFIPWINSFLPTIFYSALTAIVMGISLVWYWRLCKEHPEAVMLLAMLPLFFEWRSLSSYFYCCAFPMFILLAARSYTSKGSLLRRPFRGPLTTFVESEVAVEEEKVAELVGV